MNPPAAPGMLVAGLVGTVLAILVPPAAAGEAAQAATRARSAAAAPAAAQPDPAGPTVTVDPPAARPGDPVAVTVSGFESLTVTVTVCGNLALRGSADCDVRSGEGVTFGASSGEDGTILYVTSPPAPCPCVVRVANSSHDEVAAAPIDIIGAPTAPVVESATGGPLVAVAVEARRAPQGILGAVRAALGGPARYDIEVTVRNVTAGPLRAVRISGTATRSGRQVASFGTGPRSFAPSETYVHRESVEVPAPGIGALRWEAAVSGAGAVATGERATSHTPVALLVLVAVAVGDVAAIAVRRLRARRNCSGAAAGPGDVVDAIRARWRSTVSRVPLPAAWGQHRPSRG